MIKESNNIAYIDEESPLMITSKPTFNFSYFNLGL